MANALSSLRFFVVLIVTAVLYSCGGGGGGGDSSDNSIDACGLIGLPQKAMYQSSSEVLNPKVINGTTCKSLSNSPVVRVVTANAATKDVTGLCTGTMITTSKIITAEHCLRNVGIGTNADIATIIYGDVSQLNGVRASRVFHSPRYDVSAGRVINDVAVIQLATPLSLPTVGILRSSPAVKDESGAVYGYGVTEAGFDDENIGSELVSGSMTVQDVTSSLIFVTFDGDGVNVCNGDSGGPLIVTRAGATAIAGVVSEGSTEKCTAGDITSYTNLLSPEIVTWLDRVASDAVKR